MKNLIYLLLALPLLFISCNNDEVATNEETVQVSFSTELPKRISSRSTGTTVNQVIGVVFENGNEIIALREVIDIVDGQSIKFEPSLIKGHTYDVVFWASKNGSYNVENMTAITRNTAATEADFDAFTASEEILVSGNTAKDIKLKRPFSQLKIGVTEEDWETVENNFSMTPEKIVITITGKKTFNALTGKAVGNEATITYTLNVSGTDMTAGEDNYINLASCYILPEATKENFDITYSIYGDENCQTPILENITIPSVPFENNYNTNIVGGLLTGTVTYTITLEEDFEEEENNEEIE